MKQHGGKRTLPNADEVSTVLGAMSGAMTRDQIKANVCLKDAKVVRSWCGWLDNAFDGVPFIGPCLDAEGLIVACGFTGHGFGTAPAVGLMLSQLVHGEETVVDLSALAPNRFMPNK